jgi:DNA-binding PadR family transcriptional regulator
VVRTIITPILSPSEELALLYILKNGPTYAYYLSHKKKKILGTEKTANTALNRLAHRGLLEKKKTDDKRKRKDYYLTLKGLCTAFSYFTGQNENWKKIENITDKWGHLLPLLNKFNLFKKYDLEDYFKKSLIQEASNYVIIQATRQKDDAEYILNSFIQRSMHRANADYMVKWNRVLHEDAELRQKTKWRLELDAKMTEQHLGELTRRLSQVFPKLEQQNPDWDAIRLVELNLQQANIGDSGLVFNSSERQSKPSNDKTVEP